MNKLIFISDSIADIQQVKQFAKNNEYPMEYYSTREWESNHFIKGTSFQIDKKKYKTNFSIIPMPNSQSSFFNSLEEIQEDAIKQALALAEGNVTKASMILKMGRATFYRKAVQFNININTFRPSSQIKQQQAKIKKAAA